MSDRSTAAPGGPGRAELTLYFAPLTRAVRIAWLFEELGLPHRLERVEFLVPTTTFFAQRTPTGKLPTLVDGDVVLCESGAILEYVLERYGRGRLAPPPGSPERARAISSGCTSPRAPPSRRSGSSPGSGATGARPSATPRSSRTRASGPRRDSPSSGAGSETAPICSATSSRAPTS